MKEGPKVRGTDIRIKLTLFSFLTKSVKCVYHSGLKFIQLVFL